MGAAGTGLGIGPGVLVRLIAGVALILGSGFFVGSEFALTRVRQFDEEEFSETAGLERAWEMTERLEIYLSGCQLGITITSIGLGVVTEPALTGLVGPVVAAAGLGAASGHALSAVIAVVVLNLLYLVFGEQVPTYLGIERTRTMAHYFAPALYWWTRVMYPVIRLADAVSKVLLNAVGVPITRSWTEEEGEGGEPLTSIGALQDEIGRVLSRGALSTERTEEIMSAVEIQETPVREIMVPREEITALSTAEDLATNLERVQSTPHDRYPLVGESMTEFEGIIHVPVLLSALDEDGDGVDLASLASPPMTVSAGTAVSDLIDQFQAQNAELALVIEGGEVIGVVTATDAFEAIAGEVRDPIDVGFERGSGA